MKPIEEQMVFAFTGMYYSDSITMGSPKTAAQKVKDLETKNRKLVKEVAALKAEIAALNQILSS